MFMLDLHCNVVGWCKNSQFRLKVSVADLSPNSLNFMHFWENLAKSYVGAPPPSEGLAPLLKGNPRSATVCDSFDLLM